MLNWITQLRRHEMQFHQTNSNRLEPPIALGTGMRMGEQLRMKRHQVDFLRNIVTARDQERTTARYPNE